MLCISNFHCSRACSIEESETVTITGGVGPGQKTLTRVTRYHDDGASKSLPNLNHGRSQHACGVFTKTGGSIVCFELNLSYNTQYAGVHRVRGVQYGWLHFRIYGDPGEGQGKRLAAGG